MYCRHTFQNDKHLGIDSFKSIIDYKVCKVHLIMKQDLLKDKPGRRGITQTNILQQFL